MKPKAKKGQDQLVPQGESRKEDKLYLEKKKIGQALTLESQQEKGIEMRLRTETRADGSFAISKSDIQTRGVITVKIY